MVCSSGPRGMNRAAVPAVLGALLLGGCVGPAYEPGPYPLQYYQPYRYESPPPAGYRTRPLPPPEPLPGARPEAAPEAAPETGPIPLIEMPEPTPDQPQPERPAEATPPPASSAPGPAPVVQAPPPSPGAGSNVPLEGFRPMRGQTRPTP